jgi:hypothetical protein
LKSLLVDIVVRLNINVRIPPQQPVPPAEMRKFLATQRD